MKRSQLPLNALRSFEAAGRRLSFTAAAEELHVSQAAISKQVRELEAWLGQILFERLHRAVVLTPEGERLHAVVTESFERLDVALSDVQRKQMSGVVRVNAEPAFAGCWLVPRLPEFRRLHPEIDVIVETDYRLVSFRAGGPDLAIRYSLDRQAWPQTESRKLQDVLLVAVASPRLLPESSADSEAFLALPRLHEENREAWNEWSELNGCRPAERDRGPILGDGFQVLQAALDGQGAALIDRMLASRALLAGQLLQPWPAALPYGAYHLVTRRFSRLSRAAAIFLAWVEAAMADTAASLG